MHKPDGLFANCDDRRLRIPSIINNVQEHVRPGLSPENIRARNTASEGGAF